MNDQNNNEEELNIREGESTIKPLEEDNTTPFSTPTDPVDDASDDIDRRTESNNLEPTHQQTDTNVDPHEVYDEGLSGGAEAEEPNKGNAVVDYNPEDDERNNT